MLLITATNRHVPGGGTDRRIHVEDNALLELDDFMKILGQLPLNVLPSEVDALRATIPVNGEGKVDLQAFVHHPVDLLQAMYARLPAGLFDWVEMKDEHGRAFFFNKRTGQSPGR
jgi:hypothetical protein